MNIVPKDTYPKAFTEAMILDWFLIQLGQDPQAISLHFNNGSILLNVLDGSVHCIFTLGTYDLPDHTMRNLWLAFLGEWRSGDDGRERDMNQLWSVSEIAVNEDQIIATLTKLGFGFKPGSIDDPRRTKSLHSSRAVKSPAAIAA